MSFHPSSYSVYMGLLGDGDPHVRLVSCGWQPRFWRQIEGDQCGDAHSILSSPLHAVLHSKHPMNGKAEYLVQYSFLPSKQKKK